jgi:hypothetical protein
MRISFLSFSLILFLFCGVGCSNQYLVGYYDSKDSFLRDCKWKNKEAPKYKPQPQYIDSLKTLKDSLDIKLFVGTWCSDSKKWTPRFFNLLSYLKVKSIEIIAVDTTKIDEKKLVSVYRVDSVPTFIFLKNNKFHARLNVKPRKMRLEKALYLLLK